MSIFKEAVRDILYFDPGKTVVEGQSLNLGRVNGYEVYYGNYTVQDRLVRASGQPLLFSWRTRPSIALYGVNGNGNFAIKTLTYKTDIKEINRAVVLEIAQRLREWNSKLEKE